MTHEKSTDGLGAMAAAEMAKAFRYYNYVREFYGYLCDSLDLVFEDDCNEFDPAYAPAEKEFQPTDGIDENSTARALALDKMARAIPCALRARKGLLWLKHEFKSEKMELT